MTKHDFVFTPFADALSSLEAALRESTNGLTDIQQQMMKDSLIQRFEYTYELAWKMIKRCLEMELHEILDEAGRRDLFRRAHEFGLIAEPASWFGYQEARNKTSHAYDQRISKQVLEVIPQFAVRARELLFQFEQRYGRT